MSTASQVESFCESCGTRYAFEPRRSAKRHLVKVGRLVGILPDEPDVDDSALVVSKDPFHGAFHFCLECRRFTCPTCWDAPAGFCRSCASVLNGTDGAAEPQYTLDADTQALLRAAFEDLTRLGAGDGWAQLEPPPEARPEPVANALDLGEAPEDDLGHIIEAGVAAMAVREAQAAREAAEAEEREQARLEEERRQQAEEERVAAEQAEFQRQAWEEYERQRLQYEADLAAWEAAEAARLESERLEAAEAARLESERLEAERIEAERIEAARLEAERTEPDPAVALAAAGIAAERAEAERLAKEQAEQAATRQAEAERLAAEAERLAAQRAEAERLAAEAEEQRAAQVAEDPVWESLAGALGPDVAAEGPAPAPAPERPQLPPVPHVPPPTTPGGTWPIGMPPPGARFAPPPPMAGFRPAAPGWNGGQPLAMQGQAANGQLRTGIRPCARCDLALSANARFCRRCGLPQG